MPSRSRPRLFLGPGDNFKKVMTKTKSHAAGIIFEIVDGGRWVTSRSLADVMAAAAHTCTVLIFWNYKYDYNV
jgi:hypothetical protein